MDVFVHIPKSSGSTIRAILSREYGVKSILYFEPGSGEWKKSASSPAEFLKNRLSKRNINLITGHHPFGIHSILKSPCRYFSVMRDPIDRVLSDYYYAFTYSHHRQREEIISGELTLSEFMTSNKYSHGSEQTAMLAGNFSSLEGSVQTAIENIQNSFAMVGTAERFDESILLISKALGWKPPLYIMKNVTKLDSDKQVDRASARAHAHGHYTQYFREDYAVYRAADSLLSQFISAEGQSFQRALEAFREIQHELAGRAEERIFELYEFQEDDRLPDFAAEFVGSSSYRAIEDYLAQSTVLPPPAKNYVGKIDSLGPGPILGWAGDLSSPRPIHVTIWRSGEKIATVPCAIRRNDLLEAGFNTGEMGFKTVLQDPITNSDEYSICFDDSAIRVPSN